MDKFYSGSGDDGFTGLLGDARIAKYHPRAEAIGALDEASAALGLARALCRDERSSALLVETQRDLYKVMAEVAATPENVAKFHQIDPERVSWLESQIDVVSASIEKPGEFILPGDSLPEAGLALARTTVRRAERRVARLLHDHAIENAALLSYLNRLSSLCFVLELVEIQASGKEKPTLARDR